MKRASFLGSVLSVLACIHIAHSMFCFVCEDQTSNWKCLRMTRCPPNEKRCLTIGNVSRMGNHSKLLITKKCADKCPSEREYAYNSLFCCESCLCNVGPPK